MGKCLATAALLALLCGCHEQSFDERYRTTQDQIAKEDSALATALATEDPTATPRPAR
jgi:ABC-type uncharacterized transport system auxiliary subunit